MDERIGVDHLHGCHERLNDLSLTAKQRVAFLHKNGAQSFASGLHAVIHGINNRPLKTGLLRKVGGNDFLCLCYFFVQCLFKTHPNHLFH